MLSPERLQKLVKPKHRLVMRGNRLVREHAGFYENRDVQGTRIHWEWLLAKWDQLAYKIELEERWR